MTTVPKRILLAEDDHHSRRVLAHYLTVWGYQVIEARDGLEAAAILGSPDTPHIALVDWMMPGMEGVEVCASVRGRVGHPFTYLILLTAKSDKQEIAAGLEAGADDYVTKPCDPTELRARLKAGERVVELERTLAQQVQTLQETLDQVRQLKQLIPICAWCKRVRDDEDYWHNIEEYLHLQTGSDFTHGICPHCLEAMRASVPGRTT